MKNVEYLLGSEKLDNRPMLPFDDNVCDFIAEISTILLHDTVAKQYPDILSFAFWCRKANIKRLKEKFNSNDYRIGRGIIFHIAPSNVPVNFAFSCLFSMLAGNSNLVRVPSKRFPQIDIIISAFMKASDKFPNMLNKVSFIRYQRNDEITAELCKDADGRVIWGGDATVSTIKNITSKPRCIDMVFPDRYSFAILDGKAVRDADESTMNNLAQKFYNDTFLMDQNACSSPHIIFWNRAERNDKEKFWKAIALLAKKEYVLQPASVVDKFDQSCRDAVNIPEVSSLYQYENIVYVVSLNNSILTKDMDICSLRGNSGYFYECDLDDFDSLSNVINEKYQTVTYFGIDPEKIRLSVMTNHVRGIDRIVPIGEAMNIGLIWDGYDIIRFLSRIVTVD